MWHYKLVAFQFYICKVVVCFVWLWLRVFTKVHIPFQQLAILQLYKFRQLSVNLPTHGPRTRTHLWPQTFCGSHNFPLALFIYLFVCPPPVSIILKFKNIFDCGLWHVRIVSINAAVGCPFRADSHALQFPKPPLHWKI